MDQTIKKKLARNWFKTLQEVICQEIEELEAKKNIFKIKNWERGIFAVFVRKPMHVPMFIIGLKIIQREYFTAVAFG